MLHHHALRRIRRVGGAIAKGIHRTALAVDKGIGQAHQFLTDLSPEARELAGELIGRHLGQNALHGANRLARGLDQYENVRAHLAGGY
jgi:hypothetical protein